MNTKFLSDGRKVSVIGKLNNNESIVQEVFVTKDGAEIPSGENFTTKSLHDAPVESYKSREEKRILASIAKLEESLKKSTKEEKKAREGLKAVSRLLQSSKQFAASVEEDGLETMAQFVTGTIEYLVVCDYRIEMPVKMIDKVFSWECYYGERSFDGLKLVSALGKSGGDIQYKIHTYGDGSGSRMEVYPFTTLEGASSKIKEIALKKIENNYGFSMDEFQICNALGIEFSGEQMEVIRETMIKSQKDSLGHAEKNLKAANEASKKALDSIAEINEKLGL